MIEIFIVWNDNGIDYQDCLGVYLTEAKAKGEAQRRQHLNPLHPDYVDKANIIIERMEVH